MTTPNNEPIKYTCEYCGSQNHKAHTKDCKLAKVPWLFRDGHVIPSDNRRALSDLREAVVLYMQK